MTRSHFTQGGICKEARSFGRELAAAGISRDASTRRAVVERATGLDGTKIKWNNRFKAKVGLS